MKTSGRSNSALLNTTRFVRHAIERRANKKRFIVADKTGHQILIKDGLMQLRYYPHMDSETFELDTETVTPVKKQHKIPVLLVPPLGVYGWIYDLMAERSWVRFLNARGFQVYLVDWGDPNKKNTDISLDSYVNKWLPQAINKVLEHSGQEKLSIIGYCMGGLLSLLYCCIHDRGQVQNVVTIASPVDFHARPSLGRFLGFSARTLKKLPFKSRRLSADNFHIPGATLSLMFKLTNPAAGLISYLDLLKNLADRNYVTEYQTMGSWFDDMPDYPGATVRSLIFDFALNNKLAKGELKIGGQPADLASIKSNLLAFAGRDDNIVSLSSTQRLMELVMSRDKTFEVVPGGHAGVFAGGNAQRHTWSITADWLAARSD